MAVAIIGGEGLNVSFMVGLAFAIAASANFPALLLALDMAALQHGRRGDGRADRCHLRARTHHHQPDRLGRPSRGPRHRRVTWYDLNNPGLISIPLGFVGCVLGTLLSTERETERSFHELHVRSETGLGAERAVARSWPTGPANLPAALGRGAGGRERALELAQSAGQRGGQLAAGIGQAHGAARAVGQHDAELVLEAADVAAERRLRDVEAHGGAPEVQLGRQRLERAQIAQLDHGGAQPTDADSASEELPRAVDRDGPGG